MTLKLLTLGIPDAKTQQAFRQIQQAVNDTNAAIDVLDDRTTEVESSLTSLSAGVITEVIAGTNLSGGGTSGSVTLNVIASPTFAGNVAVGGTLGVTGATTLGALTVNGAADFNSAVNMDSTLTLSPMTAGSVLFAGTGGLVSQDNAGFYYDAPNDRVAIGHNSPQVPLHVVNSAISLTSIGRLQSLNPTGNSSFDFYDEAGVNRFGIGYDNLPDRAQLSMNNSTPFVIVDNSIGQTVKFFNNGRVNIGGTTTDPGVLLRVQGTAIITGATALSSTATVGSTLAVTGNMWTLADLGVGTAAPGTDLEVFGTDAECMVHYTGQSRGGLRALATQRIGLVTTDSADDLVFGYSSGHKGAFTRRMIIDNGTAAVTMDGALAVTGNLAVNTNKFTVTASSGNTTVAGTLGVTGLATLTAGFSLGADSSAASHKITNLTNGSSAQDAAAFGQIATAVSTAVSGTTNTIAKFTAANVVGNSSITDTGALVTITNALAVTGSTAIGDSPGVDTHTVSGAVDITSTNAAAPALTFTHTPVASTGTGINSLRAISNGTYDTTAGAILARAMSATTAATRIAGANDLQNVAGKFDATGGQVNVAVLTESGSNYLNVTNGSTGVGYAFGAALPATLSVTGTFATTGNVTLGDAGSDSHTINGRVALSSTDATVNASTFTWTPVAGTGTGINGVRSTANGTFNTTAGAIEARAFSASISATRSSGANDLRNVAGKFDATGGQLNVALFTDNGSNYLNASGGNTGIGYAFAAALPAKLSVTGAIAATSSITVSGTAATISSGTGTPEGVVTAPVGSVFLRTDGGAGTTLYVKQSGAGNTGWVGK